MKIILELAEFYFGASNSEMEVNCYFTWKGTLK